MEFAKRVGGNWNVAKTASYSSQLAPGTFYNLKVDVYNTTVKEYINGTEIMTYDNAFEFTHGRIGVQADNANVYYDNIKITLPVDYIEEERYQFATVVDVYQPTTGIVAPATTLVWFDQLSQLDQFKSSVRPATSIFRVNSDLNVVSSTGTVLLSLEEALIAVDGKVIPAFQTNDAALAATLAQELKDLRIYDLFLVSDNPEAILAARAVHGVIRGILNYPMTDVTSLSKEDLMNVRRQTNTAQAVASIIPIHLLNQDLVLYMQQRAMTVFVSAPDDDVSQYKAILSGANGIVSNNYQGLFAKYALFTETTHVRRPLMIGHRGLYAGGLSSAPENTIEAAQEAYLRGADILELDVYLTIDLEIVIIHDSTTARTAPAYEPLTIVSSFLSDIKAINLADPIGGRTDLKIPTLREYFEEFKGKDVVIYVEIKPTMPLLVQLVAELIDEMDMYDQTAIIVFAAQNILTMNEVYPEISNGLLTGAVLNAMSVNTSITNTISTVVPINSTLNPSFGALTLDYMKAIVHRGITVWPWTLNDYAIMNQYYNYGIGGMTTDHLGYYENTFNRLTLENQVLSAFVEDATKLKVTAQIETPNGTTYPYMPNYTVVSDGGTGVTLDATGKVLTATNPGTFTAYTTFNSTLPDGTPFTITSDLLEIVLSAKPVEPEEPIVDPDDVNNTAIIIVAAIGGSAALGAAGYFGFRFFKLRKVV
ncbi:MAG: glycerophosphodiester phosphodiesterase family protein [Acholeplasmataceae bacterium]|nr:glycerophosphodiester phosphodiesterase family protein [Acholeplasmataceae bacterium]